VNPKVGVSYDLSGYPGLPSDLKTTLKGQYLFIKTGPSILVTEFEGRPSYPAFWDNGPIGWNFELGYGAKLFTF
jgi:hypothetical protein